MNTQARISFRYVKSGFEHLHERHVKYINQVHVCNVFHFHRLYCAEFFLPFTLVIWNKNKAIFVFIQI